MAGRRGSFRWLSPVERAAIAARFRAGARVADVVAEFGVARTSAARIRGAGALARRRAWHSPHRVWFGGRGVSFGRGSRGGRDRGGGRRRGRVRAGAGRRRGPVGGGGGRPPGG